MTIAIKRRKIEEESSIQQAPLAPNPIPQIPKEIWELIASFLPLAPAQRLALTCKNLSILSLPPIHMTVFHSCCEIANNNAINIKTHTVDVLTAINLLQKNRIHSISVYSFGNPDLALWSFIGTNKSCRALKVDFPYSSVQSEAEHSHFLTRTLSFLANKSDLEFFRINQDSFTPDNNIQETQFSFSKQLGNSLLNQLQKNPIKHLSLDARRTNIFDFDPQNFKKITHLKIKKQKLSHNFWNGLKNCSNIQSLTINRCQSSDALEGNSISFPPNLEKLNILFNENAIAKSCISALSTSIPLKLKTLTVLYDTYVDVNQKATEVFFQKIGQPKSPIQTLTINSPICFRYLKEAPWNTVEVQLETNENLPDFDALKERKKPLLLTVNCKTDGVVDKTLRESLDRPSSGFQSAGPEYDYLSENGNVTINFIDD